MQAFEAFYPESTFDDRKADSANIHESSYVDSPCQIGSYTEIMRFSHVMGYSVIGNHCLIGNNVTVASGVWIANGVKIMNNATINSGVILEDKVYCGPSTVFTDNQWLRSSRLGETSHSRVVPTVVRQGAKIGANTTIGSGFTIGKFAFVEAGSVIDSHVPDFAIVYGNPIQFGGWLCRCGSPLKKFQRLIALQPGQSRTLSPEPLVCGRCERQYAQNDDFHISELNPNSLAYCESQSSYHIQEGYDLDSHSQPFPPI